jgi:hypothetical protein
MALHGTAMHLKALNIIGIMAPYSDGEVHMVLKDRVECFDDEGMQPTTCQKMAKPIQTTEPTRKPENNTKHQRNGIKLTGPKQNTTRFYMLLCLFKNFYTSINHYLVECLTVTT